MTKPGADRRARWFATALSVVVLAGLVGCTSGGRPAPVGPGAARPSESAPVAHAPATPQATTVRYVFPVAGTASYARTHHDYPASDIMAPCGATVRAVTDGAILEVNRVDRYQPAINDGATRGGLFVSVLGDDGVRYYGSHLRVVEAGLAPGVRVTAGQKLGAVGATGDASACHLHFGISPPCAGVGDWSVRRGAIWPWSYLDSWRKGGGLSPVAEISAWHRAHGCPTA